MNILRSLEQKRSKFAYDLLKKVIELRDKDNLERLNGLFKIICEKNDVSLTKKEFDILRTDKKGEIKNILDKNFQKMLEEKLSSYISRSPTMILVNGLGNTVTFYLSKIGEQPENIPKIISKFKIACQNGKVDEYKKRILDVLKPDKSAYLIIYTAINNWLKDIGMLKNADNVVDWFKKDETSSLDVMHATKETIELLKWMKRFADAMLEAGELE